MFRVAALLYPNALATSVTLPQEILQAAAQIARVRSRHAPGMELLLASAGARPTTLFGGLTLAPDLDYRELPALDLLILPAIWRNPQPVVRAAGPWLGQLCAVAESGATICAVGTATCLLAQAGLLDGRPATTHWNYFEHFAARYPKVQLKTRHLITQSDNIFCVGSVNSIADLMVHLVEGWYGDSIARAVENQFSPEIRRPFGAAAYQTSTPGSHHDELVAAAQDRLQSNLSGPIPIAELARQLGLSSRTLNRRFHQATGMSPLAWLQQLRVNQARELLRHSNLSVSEVAWQVGLQDLSHFARLFREQVGMPPARFREAVRGKLFEPGRG